MSVGTGTAIALSVAAASAASGAYAAHKQGESADQASGLQKSLMDRQSELAQQMMTLGKGQISGSKPALDAAMKYYMTLGSGDRGAVNAALAPDRAGVADTARGVERGMMAHMGPGAQRDQAFADLSRQKQGQLGLMPFQARADAMGKLADMGRNQANSGYNFLTGAAGALGGQSAGINNMFNMQQQGNQAWSKFGADIFNTYGPYLMNMANKQQKPVLSSRPTSGISLLPAGNKPVIEY